MRERLIERRPKAKPSDDHWMLDRWTPLESHVVVGVYREIKDREQRVVEKVYRLACSCGWRSIEYHRPLDHEVCPVLISLQDRARRQRGNDRIEWKPVE